MTGCRRLGVGWGCEWKQPEAGMGPGKHSTDRSHEASASAIPADLKNDSDDQGSPLVPSSHCVHWLHKSPGQKFLVILELKRHQLPAWGWNPTEMPTYLLPHSPHRQGGS